jgi:hypothetical protein
VRGEAIASRVKHRSVDCCAGSSTCPHLQHPEGAPSDRMGNSEAKAREWVKLLADEPAVPFGSRLREHFAAARITRVCDCGCNSFDVEIPSGVSLEPLAEPGNPQRKIFEIVYESTAEADLAFLIFVDARGYLSSIDVTCGEANHALVPDDVRLGRVLHAG